jgi:hypothetical protein
MKVIAAFFIALFAVVGVITVGNFAIETFSDKKVSEEIERPNWYVYYDGIQKSQDYCEKSGGILSIASMRMRIEGGGQRYKVKCMFGNEITFEIK